MTRSARSARLLRDGRAPPAPGRGEGTGENLLVVISPRRRAVLGLDLKAKTSDNRQDKKLGKIELIPMKQAFSTATNRTSSESHSWINFTAKLSDLPFTLWMQLGEANSKCHHIAGVPLLPEVARALYVVWLSKGVHATTSIEGNTLTEEQVQQRIEGKLKLPKSQQYLGNEVDSIVGACNKIVDDLLAHPDMLITSERIRAFNGMALKGCRVEDEVHPGEFRTYSVGVLRYRGAPWEECPYLVERLCEWLNGPGFDPPDPDVKFALTLCKAILAHLYIAWIHPFGDGNGRTARLVEVQILMQSGLPFPACQLLSNHYNKTRTRYYEELDRSSKEKDGYLSFISYAVQGFVDGLREQLDYIRSCQWKVTWENYVHGNFHGKETPSCIRQKNLVLDMTLTPTPRKALMTVSPRVALAYGGKGEKTLTRDLNALISMKLIRRVLGGFIPNHAIIQAFPPPSIDEVPRRRTPTKPLQGPRSD